MLKTSLFSVLSSSEKMVSIRIINVDFYMSPPIQSLDAMYSEFRGTSVHQVPVIRIFGSLNTGKNTFLALAVF